MEITRDNCVTEKLQTKVQITSPDIKKGQSQDYLTIEDTEKCVSLAISDYLNNMVLFAMLID